MTLELYRILHIAGLLAVFLGLGGAMALANSENKGGSRVIAVALHGLGLLVVLVAGFGMQARLQTGFPLWLIAKLGIWVLLGAMPVLVRKKILPGIFGWIVALAAGAAAVWMVVEKPF